MWLPDELKPLSSKVDWCEENYVVVSFIAEFWNTVSNVLFIIIPPIMINRFRQYEQELNMPIRFVWALLMTVGIGSIYFHATLSLAGQLLDEIAILWVVLAAWALFVPETVVTSIFPSWFTRRHFYYFMLVSTVLLTLVCLVKPEMNHNALFVTSGPSIAFSIINMRRTKNTMAARLALTSIVWFILGFACWILDRNFCDYLRLFPYLHSFWHVFVCLGGYLSIVSGAFFYAEFNHPETMPSITFWPDYEKMTFIGIPYVTLNKRTKSS